MSNANLVPYGGTSRSPQADIIDELIWSRLGKFWTDAYNPEDKDALSSVYEAMFTVLDAEYVRLFEINQAKSIRDCPVFTQRRWAQLDMNKYAQVRAFLQFLRAGTAGLIGGLAGNILQCSNVPDLHSKHWHISFPWTIPNINSQLRGLLNLQFPITSIALVEIYKMYDAADGTRRGVRLMPRTADDSVGWEFELLPDGHTIHIRNAAVNQQYEILAGFDFSGAAYDGLRPRVFQVENLLGTNICQVPDSMSDGLPVHALVVRNPPQIGTTGLEVTNREDFDTERIFIPYTGDFTGVQHGSSGLIVLPQDFTIHIGDVVYLFGTEAGPFDTIHTHKRDSVAFEQSDLIAGVLIDYTPSIQIPLGMFGSIDFLGQQLHLFINGRMIAPSQYNYEYASNTFHFLKPIAGSKVGQTFVDVIYMDELRAGSTASEPFHIHQSCYRGSVQVPKQFSKFDDGGTFDDEDTNPPATFDDYDYDNRVYINDLLLKPEDLEVFVDGVLMENETHYVITKEPRRTQITFKIPIIGKNVLVTIIKSSLIFVYGLDDIIPSSTVYGITTDTLKNILSDLQNVVAQFETFFGSKISDLATLLEAAFIAAGGGNPLLALFLDEFKEYDGLPLDAPNLLLSAVEARAVESANTKLIGIPFLTDHVLNPNFRLESGAQYEVIDGNIQSSIDLTIARSEDDPAPGVWWCPVVILDESMLAKNFGTLVGDVRPDSSAQYKNALISNLMLRYGGPIMSSISNTAAVMLGSDMFTQDSKILRIDKKITEYHITITAVNGTRQDVFIVSPQAPLPQVGATIYPGQSVAFPVIVDLVLDQLETWEPGLLTVNYDLGRVQAGDRARLSVYDPKDVRAKPVSVELNVTGVHTRPTLYGQQTVIQFDQAIKFLVTRQSRLRVFRDYGEPRAGFEATVTGITTVENTVITTESEVFELLPSQLLEFKTGDQVFRGQPVRPGLAVAYDHTSKPNWHWITPAQWREVLKFSVEDQTFGFVNNEVVEKYGSIAVPAAANKFSVADMADLGYAPARGTLVTVIEDGTDVKYQFKVVGIVGQSILMAPAAIKQISGLFQFRASSEFQKLDYQKEYFEIAPTKYRTKTGNLVSPFSTQSFSQRAGAAMIEASDLSHFPPMGRVNVMLTGGGVVEFEYFSRTNTRFFNCHWTEPFVGLMQANGFTNTLIPATAQLLLVAEYRDKLINPAFSAIVSRRTSVIDPGNRGPVQLTDENIDEVYALLRASTAVLELRSVQEPAVLEAALAEVTPPGTSLQVIHKDVQIDEVRLPISDRNLAYDNIAVTIVAQNAP